MHLDRLASLVQGVAVTAVHPGPRADAAFSIGPLSGGSFAVRVGSHPSPDVLVSVLLDPGCAADPMGSLSGFTVEVAEGSRLFPLVAMLVDETQSPRCGATSLLAAYSEAILVHVLRHAIERGMVETGLLAGLSDPRLARAIVAIHDDPGRDWQASDLAALSGMSRAAFMARFRDLVGETPMAYLRRWRIARARDALARGGRVGIVARQLGYSSADAFTRAFRAAEGRLPSEVAS